MAESVDARDLGSRVARRAGSMPVARTTREWVELADPAALKAAALRSVRVRVSPHAPQRGGLAVRPGLISRLAPGFDSQLRYQQGRARMVERQSGGLEDAGSSPAALTKESDFGGRFLRG